MKTFDQADAMIQTAATLARKIKDVMVATEVKRPMRMAAYAPQRSAMRASLGDSSAPMDPALATYATPSASRLALASRMKEIGRIRDPGEKAVARQQVIDLLQAQQAYERYMDSMRPESYMDFTLAQALQNEGHTNSNKVPDNEFLKRFASATAASIELGKDFLPDDMAETLAKARTADESQADESWDVSRFDPDLGTQIKATKARQVECVREWNEAGEIKIKHRAEVKALEDAGKRGTPEIEQAREAYLEHLSRQNTLAEEYKKLNARMARLQKKSNAVWRDARHQLGAGAEVRAEVGRAVISKVLEKSSISQKDAEEWANSRKVSASARSALSRQGYNFDKFLADLADFYRFTNGRVRHVSFDTDGKGRANASGIGEHTTDGVINIGSSFPRSVLWHELAHYMEADTGMRYQSAQWIRGRASGPAYSLKAQYPNKGYSFKETALPGPFSDAYVGKLYGDGMTEVFSMGLEYLSDPHYLGAALDQDPEHLQFVLGALSRPATEIEKATATLRNMVLGAAGEARSVQADSRGVLIDKLATLAKLAPTAETMATLTEQRYVSHMVSRQRESLQVLGEVQWTGAKPPSYSGHSIYVAEGLVRQGNGSNRLVKGLCLLQKISALPVNLAGAKMPEVLAASVMLLCLGINVTMRTLSELELMKNTFEVAND